MSTSPINQQQQNVVSPDAVSGREATVLPFNAQGAATQTFNTPGALWGSYLGNLNAPNQAAVSATGREGNMIGGQQISPPLIPQLPGTGALQAALAALASAAPAALGAIGHMFSGGGSSSATATGGNATSSSTGGAGGNATSSSNTSTTNQGATMPPLAPQHSYNFQYNPATGTYNAPPSVGSIGGGNIIPYSIQPQPIDQQTSPQLYGPLGPTASQYNGGVDMGPQTQAPGPAANTTPGVWPYSVGAQEITGNNGSGLTPYSVYSPAAYAGGDIGAGGLPNNTSSYYNNLINNPSGAVQNAAYGNPNSLYSQNVDGTNGSY